MQTMVLVVCDIAVGPRAAADLPRRGAQPGARRAARDARRLRRADGRAACADDGDRRCRQPGIDRRSSSSGRRRLRDQQRAQEPALAHHDGGLAPGPAPPPRAAPDPAASVREPLDLRRSPGSSAGACAVTLGAGVGARDERQHAGRPRRASTASSSARRSSRGATALPEISSGIAAVRLGDHALALGDIFGGNAFQLCLFLVADLVAGSPVLPTAGSQNAWLASLGVGLTAIFAMGVVIRPLRCRARLGPDSIFAIVVFAIGIAGLFVVPHY